MYDLIVKNGFIIDGTGSPSFRSDIAIKDGKIAKIGRNINADSKFVIDAKNLMITPGFIDSHSHSDSAVFSNPEMIEKAEQGITTSIGGQCGSTLAPVGKSVTKDNATDVAGFGKSDVVYKSFGSMMSYAKDIPLGSNIASFVGHGAIREAVIGLENRKPTPDEMEKMKELLREAMESGAIGISFGLIYTPSCYAETDELIELARVVKEYEGVISAHIRNENFELAKAIEEFITVIKAVDIKGVISHHKAMYDENWGKVHHTLAMIEGAVKEGYDIYCDVYPYTASSTSLVPTIIPKEMRDKDDASIVKLLGDDNIRRKIKEIRYEKFGKSLDNLLITQCKGHPEYEGSRISELAAKWGIEDYDAAFDIIIESGAQTSIANFAMCEEDLETVLKYERTMVCTDSSVAGNLNVYHPRLRGSFPRVLGRYVRERKVTSLHDMIRKCTSMPASVYSLHSKGILREGFDADICIFDAQKIIDKSEYHDCHKRCEGLNYVIVGGEIVVENAVYNGKRPGKMILCNRY